MPTENYAGYLIIDWRNGSMRRRQSSPALQPYEVAIKFKVAIKVPELMIPVIDIGTIEVPEVKVEATEFEPQPLATTGCGA